MSGFGGKADIPSTRLGVPLTGNQKVAYCEYGSSVQSPGRRQPQGIARPAACGQRPDAERTLRAPRHDAASGQQAFGILEEANLVATVKQGREKLHYLNPVPIHDIAERWIRKFERHRLQALSELKKGLEVRDE